MQSNKLSEIETKALRTIHQAELVYRQDLITLLQEHDLWERDVIRKEDGAQGRLVVVQGHNRLGWSIGFKKLVKESGSKRSKLYRISFELQDPINEFKPVPLDYVGKYAKKHHETIEEAKQASIVKEYIGSEEELDDKI